MNKTTSFYCQFDEINKKDKYYQGFFRKEVSEKDFFGAQRKYLNETNMYRILPVLENGTLDTITFLEKKAYLSRKNNWESDMGERVSVKAEFSELKKIQETYEKNPYYIPKCINLKVWIYSEKTGNPLFKDNFTIKIFYSYENYEYWNYSADYLSLLIRNAINGNLQTARDIEETLQKRNLDIYLEKGWNIFKCDECNERFNNLNDFYCHLLEEGHYDSFLDEFPNDRETLHVKNMLKKN